MVPYYEADLLARIMDSRLERVKLSQTFYIEYLKLVNHYEMLDPVQKQQWKHHMKLADGYDENKGTELSKRPPADTYGPLNFDHFANRNEKVEMFKRKKALEKELDMLKNYKDEDMKREFYLNQVRYSIFRSLEQLGVIN
jgi:hypothetical protein